MKRKWSCWKIKYSKRLCIFVSVVHMVSIGPLKSKLVAQSEAECYIMRSICTGNWQALQDHGTCSREGEARPLSTWQSIALIPVSTADHCLFYWPPPTPLPLLSLSLSLSGHAHRPTSIAFLWILSGGQSPCSNMACKMGREIHRLEGVWWGVVTENK